MRTATRALLAQTDWSDVTGLRVDYENGVFTRLAAARGRSAGTDFNCFAPFGGRRRCCAADDGTVNAFYGEPGYTEDGSNGQVMVYQPKFYYRVEPLTLAANGAGEGCLLKKANYYISPGPKPGFKLHPAFYRENGAEADHILLSAYEASYYDASLGKYFVDGTDTDTAVDFQNDRLCSLPDKKPVGGTAKNLKRSNAEKLAKARGAGWHIETIKAHAANQLLMTVEFGTMNAQNALSRGVVTVTDLADVNCSSLTGSTASLGNASGTASATVNEKAGVTTTLSTTGGKAVAYRGQENLWGNQWKHLNGINIYYNSAASTGTVYLADDYLFSDDAAPDNYRSAGITLFPVSGYTMYMGYGGEAFDWLFLPVSTGGTSSGPVGDGVFFSNTSTGTKVLQYGGRWDFGVYAGPFCFNYQRSTSYSSRDFGCRLIFVP